MKILQIFGAVVAVHLLAFIFIFASPGCQSGPQHQPTPDATVPTLAPAPLPTYSEPVSVTPPADLSAPVSYNPASPSGYAAPTRPGSANAVAITAPKPPENVAPVSTYTVERGDSLWSIAKKHGLTVAELSKANSLPSGAALKPGRKLIIPGKPGQPAAAAAQSEISAPAATTAAAKPANGEAVRHTVQSGESLGVIARKYGVSVGELAAANNITDPSKVRAGQSLIVPGYKATGTRGSAVTSSKPAATTTTTTVRTNGTAPTTTTEPAKPVEAPHFELTPPPADQDLDAGLKDAPTTEVPTIKVEDPAPSTPPTN
jgi:LysM repeat protein